MDFSLFLVLPEQTLIFTCEDFIMSKVEAINVCTVLQVFHCLKFVQTFKNTHNNKKNMNIGHKTSLNLVSMKLITISTVCGKFQPLYTHQSKGAVITIPYVTYLYSYM